MVNRMQACAITLTKADIDWSARYWPFVVCMESNYEREGVSSAQKCSQDAGIDYQALETCYTGSEGDAAVVREAKETIDHPGTPYLAVNGESVEANELLRKVCAAYAGTKPAGCRGLSQGTPLHARKSCQ